MAGRLELAHNLSTLLILEREHQACMLAQMAVKQVHSLTCGSMDNAEVHSFPRVIIHQMSGTEAGCQPAISIVIPVCNGTGTLRACLESVYREQGLLFAAWSCLMSWFSYLYSGLGLVLGAGSYLRDHWRAAIHDSSKT